MKKLLSILLTAAILLTLAAAAPVSAGAEGETYYYYFEQETYSFNALAGEDIEIIAHFSDSTTEFEDYNLFDRLEINGTEYENIEKHSVSAGGLRFVFPADQINTIFHMGDNEVKAYFANVDAPAVTTVKLFQQEFKYEVLDDGNASLTGYYGSGPDLRIPESIDGYPVTTIASQAFFYCDLVTVVIPACITEIDSFAFSDVIILGYPGTEAERYAKANAIPFLACDDPNLLIGDADCDGGVTILDATAIQRHLVNLPNDEFIEVCADADAEGGITILDATAIQRYLASLPTTDRIGTHLG